MRKTWDGVALLTVAAACAASWSVLDRLPDPLPTHFALDGTPNGWMPRAYGAWFIPALSLVLWAFLRFLPLLLPKKRNNTPTARCRSSRC